MNNMTQYASHSQEMQQVEPKKQPRTDAIFDRLSEALDAKNDSELARRLNMKRTTLASRRGRGSIPYEECVTVAREEGISLDWLLLGTGSKYVTEGAAQAAGSQEEAFGPLIVESGRVGSEQIDNYVVVPLWREPGLPKGKGKEVQGVAVRREWVQNTLRVDPADLAYFQMENDSMESTLRVGDMLLVDLNVDDDHPGDGVYLICVGGSPMIRRMQRLVSGRFLMSADNPAYKSQEIDLDQVELVGRILWCGRRV